jgi:HK97 family phage major capsid protein
MDKIKEMLADIQAKLAETVKGGDDKPITVLEAFKMFPELQVKYAEMEVRFKEIESKVQSRKWADMPGVSEGKEKFSMFKALHAIQTRDFSQAGYEESVMKEASKKALGYTNDTAGGYLVPAQAVPELVEYLRSEPVCTKLGARVIPNLQGNPVTFPKQTGGATVYWIGDNVAVDPSSLTFGQLSLTPHKAMALVQLSNSLIRMSIPEAEALVNQDIGLQMALAVDYAALRGPGSSNQPLGIANTPGIGTYAFGATGAVVSNLDVFTELEYQLAAANALRGKLGFAFNPVLKKNLKQLKIPQFSGDTGTQPLIGFLTALTQSSFMTDQALEAAMGYPFATTTQIPTNLVKSSSTNCTEIYFGNWQELLIGQWAGLRIQASDVAGTAFAADQTWIRIIMEVDVAVRHAASFALCSDARIAAAN